MQFAISESFRGKNCDGVYVQKSYNFTIVPPYIK